MSWDASIALSPCEHCGRADDFELDYSNYKHNCNSMMRRAMESVDTLGILGEHHLYNLNNMPCLEAAKLLCPAIFWWRGQVDNVMADLEPVNGWGSAETALRFWGGIADACAQHPDGILGMRG